MPDLIWTLVFIYVAVYTFWCTFMLILQVIVRTRADKSWHISTRVGMKMIILWTIVFASPIIQDYVMSPS